MEGLSRILTEMGNVLTPQVSGIMGMITVVIMMTVLVFNHYSWRRAFILSAISILGIAGWYVLKLFILGSRADVGISLTETAITFLLVSFVVVGYIVAGIISSLLPLPVVTLRLMLRNGLIFVAHTIKRLRGLISELLSNLSDTLFKLSETLYKGESPETFLTRLAESIPDGYSRDPDRIIERDIHPLVLEIVNNEKTNTDARTAASDTGVYSGAAPDKPPAEEFSI